MNDDKEPTKLEILQAQMRAYWRTIDGEETQTAKVVHIDSRQPYVAEETPGEEEKREIAAEIVNRMLVEELQMLLQQAEAGQIASMSYAIEDIQLGGFCGNTIFSVQDDQTEETQALKHIGALEKMKDVLVDISYSDGEEVVLFDDDYEEDE